MLKSILHGCCLLIMLTATSLKAQTVPYKEEVRGVWITNVDSDVLSTREKIAEAMDYLASRGFNVVFPVVWNKGFTLYPSRTMRSTFGASLDQYNLDFSFKSQNRDPLREIIIEAHRNGMEVIPWFEFGFSSSYSQNGGHIIAQKPHWKGMDVTGKLLTKNGFEWMDAINPEVQQFMLNLLKEVIVDYDVDGVQGDDRLPAMPAEGGYTDYAILQYRAENNGENPPANFADAKFMKWKADKLTSFGGKVYRMVKQHDPNLIVSMSPSIYPFSYSQYLQDWPRWMDSSYVDILHPQAYRYDIGSYRTLVTELVGIGGSSGYVKTRDRAKVSPGVLLKSGSNFNRSSYVRQAVEFNRSRGVQGEVFFFYEGLREKNEFVADTLRKYYYQQPAIIPFRQGKIRRPKAAITNETDALSQRSGDWTGTDAITGFQGGVLRSPEGSNATISWSTQVKWSAWYDVYVFNISNFEASQSLKISSFGDQTRTDTTISQRQTPRGWVKVGTHYMTAGQKKIAELTTGTQNTGRFVFADAAMMLLNRKKSKDLVIDGVLLTDEPESVDLPKTLYLDQNYPNPFNPTTTVRYHLPATSVVHLEVFDSAGRRVKTLLQGERRSAGEHELVFDATELSSGVYILRLKTDLGIASRKLTLIK